MKLPPPNISSHAIEIKNEADAGKLTELRKEFAIAALAPLVEINDANGREFGYAPPQDIAKRAFDYADAMLKVGGYV